MIFQRNWFFCLSLNALCKVAALLIFAGPSIAQSTSELARTDLRSISVKLSSQDVLIGCIENFSLEPCTGSESLGLTGIISRNGDRVLTKELDSFLPSPLKNRVSGKFSLMTEHCGSDEKLEFLLWFVAAASRTGEINVSLVPDSLGICLGRQRPGVEPVYQHFCFFDGETVVASMECIRPGAKPNPICSLFAFPFGGDYEARLGSYPIVNAEAIATQFLNIFELLLENLSIDRERFFESGSGINADAEIVLEPIAEGQFLAYKN